MQISEDTVDRAFEAFHQRYVMNATRAWDLDHHGRLWADARASVESKDDGTAFLRTLEELRSHWQIARGRASKMLEFGKVLPMLHEKASMLAATKLSAIEESDAASLFRVMNDVSEIKRVQDEPSLMAISKVLHFFNPRLFVIVDRAMVWDWTLAHLWLWRPIEKIRDRVDRVVKCNSSERDDLACDVASYVAVLIWCGRLIRTNPHVAPQFASFLRRHTTEAAHLPTDLETYEAAAAEWLLLGLVELPPPGVTL